MLSGNIEIVRPEDFLRIHFAEEELLEDNSILFKACLRNFRKVKLAGLTCERDMYDLLVRKERLYPVTFLLPLSYIQPA